MHLSIATVAVLLISLANLSLIVVTILWNPGNEQNSGTRTVLTWPTKISVSAASAGQVLYLAMAAAWLFRWTRFYPGAPTPAHAIFAGLVLSLVAFVGGLFSRGFKRWATIFVALALTGLWFLAAVASVAV